MKICHIITALDFGGAERLLSYLAQVQVASHEFHVIYLKNQTKMKHLFPKEVKFHYVPLGWNCAKNIRQLVKELQPDVVHTHLGHADFVGLWAVRGLNIRTFCTMHNIWYKFNAIDYLIFAVYKSLFATIAKNCTVICISKSVEEHVMQVLAVDTTKRKLIYNAIPSINNESILTKEQARKKIGLSNDQFYILFVGRFERQKSVDTLIEAANILKLNHVKVEILLVGAGSLESNMKALVNKYELEGMIKFLGHQSEPEIFMQASNVLVLPSIFEGLGLVILEAYRAGLPVISTNIEGPKEIIKSGISGFLFEPKQPEQLAFFIQKLYDNKDLTEAISKNAHTFFQQKYEIFNYVKQLEKIYIGE